MPSSVATPERVAIESITQPTTAATPELTMTERFTPSTHVDRSHAKASAAAVDVDLDPLVATLTARTKRADVAAEVRGVVEGVAHQFRNARVRDFLPVLILKQADDRLRALGLIAK